MKLLVINKKFKAYDILEIFDERVGEILERVKTEGLFYRKILNEKITEKKMKLTGYSREKYY